MARSLKRYLFLIHRWFGIGMCLLFSLWFATGIIMMYVEYPELTEDERLDMLPALAADKVTIPVEEAVAKLGSARSSLASIKLSSVLGHPAYQFTESNGRLTTVFADTGQVLDGLEPAQAEAAVLSSGFASGESLPSYVEKLDMDQWTVSSALEPSRPLHKVALGDAAGTELYVSDVSGQVVRDTNRNERFWNWLGSTIHWIYPWQLRRNTELWTDIIVYLSLAGVISVLTGGIVGFIRLRVRKPYQGVNLTPYRGLRKWHHVLGLACLVFLSTFIFSGLMSMAPWGVFDNASAAEEQIKRYTGADPGDLQSYPTLDPARLESGVKEVEWVQIRGAGHLVLARSSTSREVLFGEQVASPSERLRKSIAEAVPALLPDAQLVSLEQLTVPDNYYYSHHNRYRPLPVLRAKFADAESTWYHIDLDTGMVVSRLTHRDRVARWLYNGMHSLDFTVLFQHRPFWDIAVILLCLTGLGFSMTSVWLGWRRLRH